jgi:tetratricopeptide (TPR) repeat protein
MAGERQRDPAYDEIDEAYRDHKLVLVVGAALSTSAGLPSPQRLVDLVAAYARTRNVDEDKLAEIADFISKEQLIGALSAGKECLGYTEFCAFIERNLDEGLLEGDVLPPLALAIAALRPKLRGVITTNLGRLLDRAFQGAWQDFARVTADIARRERFILKLHGTLADRSTWMLTSDEYAGAVQMKQALGTLFNTYSLLFVGYDLAGEDFEQIFGQQSAPPGEQRPRHFALVPAGSLGSYRQKQLEAAGVRIVLYEEPDGDQRELVRLLNDLAWNQGPAERSAPVTNVERATNGNSECPFPGLGFFDRQHAGTFFGRAAEISEAAQHLGDTPDRRHIRWLQIEGPSGAGKSSLARAGLVPAAEKGWLEGAPKSWKVAVFRPGVDPILSLAQAVRSALVDPASKMKSLGVIVDGFWKRERDLAAFLREHTPPEHGFLLVVDQLEEAFTFGDIEARKAFDALLASAARDKGGPLYLLTTIRSDFVGKMSALPELERLLNAEAGRYHLRTMSAPGMRAAIMEPAKLAGLRWEDGLPERLLDDAATAEGGLPLLAHVLQALWTKRKGNALTHAAYGELGEIGGALSQSADAILESLGQDGQARAKRLLLRLVRVERGVEDTRTTASWEEAIKAAGGGTEAERVLGRLSGQRDRDKPEGAQAEARLLVVGRGEADEGRVDLVHEALLRRWKTLRVWIEEGRKGLELQAKLKAAVQLWEAAGSQPDDLPSGGQLAYLRDAEATGERERKFLEAAVARERKRISRGRQIVAALSAGVVAFGAVAGFAAWQRTKAEQRLDDAIEVADQVVFVVDRKLRPIPGAAEVRKELLEQTSKLQDRLIAGAGDSKRALRSRMVAHNERGDLAQTHDNLVLARQEYDAGLVIATKLVALDPHNAIFHRDLATSYMKLGDIAVEGGDHSAARGFFGKALELTQALAAAYPQNQVSKGDLSNIYGQLGEIAATEGDLNTARGFLEAALDLNKELAAVDSHNAAQQQALSVSYQRLGYVAKAGGDLSSARGFFDKSLDIFNLLVAADPHNARLQGGLAMSYDMIGEVVQAEGDLAAARGFLETARGLRDALVTADPHNASLQFLLSVSYERLGDVARAAGDLERQTG